MAQSESDESTTELTRRTVMQLLGIGAGVTALGSTPGFAAGTETAQSEGATGSYKLPELPYAYDALEPHIDSQIMRLHHDKHHQGYVDGANEALKKLAEMRASGSFGEIKPVKRDLSFNLSGHVLHSLFWGNMSPDGGGEPGSALADALATDFGSVESMRKEFSAAAENVEGSGWGMLVYDHLADQLLVIQAENHNDIAIQGSTPLLVVDVWEHAYYLQYTNDRAKYIKAFWNVVDWDAVEKRYKALKKSDVFDTACNPL